MLLGQAQKISRSNASNCPRRTHKENSGLSHIRALFSLGMLSCPPLPLLPVYIAYCSVSSLPASSGIATLCLCYDPEYQQQQRSNSA